VRGLATEQFAQASSRPSHARESEEMMEIFVRFS